MQLENHCVGALYLQECYTNSLGVYLGLYSPHVFISIIRLFPEDCKFENNSNSDGDFQILSSIIEIWRTRQRMYFTIVGEYTCTKPVGCNPISQPVDMFYRYNFITQQLLFPI